MYRSGYVLNVFDLYCICWLWLALFIGLDTLHLHFSEDSGSPYFLVLEVIQVRHIHVPQGDLWVSGTGLKGISKLYVTQWYF